MYTVGQFARICSVSTRTLRHYDAIGLLRPASVGSDNLYRYYTRQQLGIMQRILFLRDLGLGLEVIREVLRSGALEDPERLAAILRERTADLRQAIVEQQQLIDRLEHAIADLHTSGGVLTMTESVVTIKDVPAMSVISARRRIAMRQFGELVEAACALIRTKPSGPPVALYHDAEFDPEAADVEFAIPLEDGGDHIVPGAKVACMTHVGPFDQVGRTYAALYAWVTEHGYKRIGPDREVYMIGPESGRPAAEYVTELQIPIG